MKIKIWGCRGSIAVPGEKTNRYGGNTSCVEIRSEDGKVFVLDAGSGIRNFGKALLFEPTISEIRFFISHAHWDHLVGFPFFEPAYSEYYNITFCSGPHAEGTIQKYFLHQMEPPYFPIEFKQLKAKFNFSCEYSRRKNDFCPLGSVSCHAFPLNHPDGGYGFKFMENGKIFIYLTDNELKFQHKNGLTRDQYINICQGADLVFHDAQFTKEEYKITRGRGHSTFMDAIDLAIEAKVKCLGLFHHDPDRTDDDLDYQVERCIKYIQEIDSQLELFPCAEEMLIEL